ncbi:hypothetical protein TWF970_000638 [Orbilia oligospora]|uniref:Peptidase S54 rhomboid domain-containing protein n=1 Tax=Orbilia oligospora TaxID=2813651 RepID=A0A7C8RNC0_ORBOL|nr:hypothetical protein TWF970_000638 [Orbilia oligospora]
MNASLGLRLASQLISRPCLCAGTRSVPLYTPLSSCLRVSTTSRTIWTSIRSIPPKPTVESSFSKKTSPLTLVRSVSFNRRARASPRTRQAPSLPAPPEPTIAKPATITGAEQEPIRYADYVRPEGSSSEEPLPPPPVSPAQKATSRYISIFGVIFFVVHVLWWAPYISGYAHAEAKERLGELEWFNRYVTPWQTFTTRWLTFSPVVALERLGLINTGPTAKAIGEKEPFLTSIAQFILPTVSHAQIWHLAFNFFALQALAPTMVRAASIAQYRETDGKVIKDKTGFKATKEEEDRHWLLGQHCRPALGASGVLSGFLAITAIVNPMAKFELMFIPIGISVRTLFMGFVTFDLMGIGMRGESIGNIGHLAGAVAGLAVWALWLRRVRLPDEIRRQLMMGLRRKKMGLD